MSTVISHGVPTTLKANVVYALPSELTFVTAAATVSTSLDGTNWTALANATTGAVTGSMFIKAAADTLVVTREATNMIQVPGSGSGSSLPTAVLGKALISQGAGVAPVFSEAITLIDPGSPVDHKRFTIKPIAGGYLVFDLENDAGAMTLRGFYLNHNNGNVTCNQAIIGTVLQATRNMHMSESLFSTLSVITDIGAFANISDSTVNTLGATVTGGGTFHVMARYNGTVWKVMAV